MVLLLCITSAFEPVGVKKHDDQRKFFFMKDKQANWMQKKKKNCQSEMKLRTEAQKNQNFGMFGKKEKQLI